MAPHVHKSDPSHNILYKPLFPPLYSSVSASVLSPPQQKN